MNFTTYAHYTPSGQLFYIGKGSEFRSTTTKNRNKKWHEVVNQAGGFKSEILAKWDTEKEALDHERFLIETFRLMGHKIVNITSGGQGVFGLKHSEQTRKILKEKSLANGAVDRCKWLAIDPITIEKRRQATTGKKRTEESKQKMAQAKAYKSRKIEVCGMCFDSISSLAKFLGKYKTTVRRWIDANQMNKVLEAYDAKVSKH